MSVTTEPTAEPTPEAGPAPSTSIFAARHRGLTTGLIGVVSAFAFEAIAVTTAMPVAARELHGVGNYGLAFSAFLTTSLLGMVLAGQVADRRGPVLPCVGAMLVFAVGLVVAGAAPTMTVLILARAVQGFGAGLNIVATYVVIGRAYPEAMRPRVFSAISSAWIVPSLVGPPIAGVLADEASWRLVFFGMLPLLAAGAWLSAPRLRGLDRPVGEGQATASGAADRRSLVWPVIAAAAGAGLLQYAGQRLDGTAVPVGLVGAALLCWSVPRLLPPGTFRLRRGLPTMVVLRGLLAGAFFGAEAFIPLMLVDERGLATTLAGASLTGAALTWSLGAWYQSRSNLPVSRHALVSSGFVLLGTGIVLVTVTVSQTVPAYLAAIGWLVAGLGMGLGLTSLSVLVLEVSAPEDQGTNSAALQVGESLGSIVLIGIGGALFAGLHDGDSGNGPVFVLIWVVMTVVTVAGAAISPRTREGRRAAASD
jgi:MFS family permease